MSKTKEQISPTHPQYERKTKIKFIIRCILGFLFGGFVGFFFAFGTDVITEKFASAKDMILNIFHTTQLYILPFVLLITIITTTILCSIHLKKAKLQIDCWDGEDNDHILVADHHLNQVSLITSIMAIANYLIFAVITYRLFYNLDTKPKAAIMLAAVAVFLGGLIITTILQNKMVNLAKKYSPEKQGSIFDAKFNDVWIDSCDEGERAMIYEASYKTFRFINKLLSTLFVITAILGMFCPIGILCAVLVGGIWLALTIYYMRESIRLDEK